MAAVSASGKKGVSAFAGLTDDAGAADAPG
jgi:hypothetical protein